MANLNGLNLNMRSSPDVRAKSIKYYVAASWILGSVTLVFTFLTIPALKVFLNTFLHLQLSTRRDPTFYEIDFILIAVTFLVSLIGILVSSTRNRRRHDRVRSSLIFISIVSFIGTIIMLVLNSLSYLFQFQ